jgi:superfamily II DNA or RNA helicase
MYLTDRFWSEFSHSTRSRGSEYFASGCVNIYDHGKHFVDAAVMGNDEYFVSLNFDYPEMVVSCSCPYYSDGNLCKHIWATMLAAERKGFLTSEGGLPTKLLYGKFLDELDSEIEYTDSIGASSEGRVTPSNSPKIVKAPWSLEFESIAQTANNDQLVEQTDRWPLSRELAYIVDVRSTLISSGELSLSLGYRELKQTGVWGKIRTTGFPSLRVRDVPEPDRTILAQLGGAREYYSYSFSSVPQKYQVISPLDQIIIPIICNTGRFMLKVDRPPEPGLIDKSELVSYGWDDSEPWQFWVEVQNKEDSLTVVGSLRRGDERMDLLEPVLITSSFVFARNLVARLDQRAAFSWIRHLRKRRSLEVPRDQGNELIEEIFKVPELPLLDLPEELQYTEVTLVPRPQLKLRKSARRGYVRDLIAGELSFNYEGKTVVRDDKRNAIFDPQTKRVIRRDLENEKGSIARLTELGFKRQAAYGSSGPEALITAKKVPSIVRTLIAEGWHVEAEGKIYREARSYNIEVTSGIDWFELHGKVDFGDTQASLPELLSALKRGENTVLLGDGTFGLLPEAWLSKYGFLASLGSAEADHFRYTRSQAGFLDALLAAQPEASFDLEFERARDQLKNFDGISAADPTNEFKGKLRGYQREGLGWLNFLQQFGFGGCLADDMGLGKTVQVLALLASRRCDAKAKTNGRRRSATSKQDGAKAKDRLPPSLVVVPRSLVFNWIQEASRFTPALRVLDHTGMSRLKSTDHFADFDLILTTYGTMIRDIAQFKDFEFDYVILDEAQAIKNASTETSKASRLLRGSHRLAMSGTPIENHLGELWSLFQFLNPGLLGTASVFKLNTSSGRSINESEKALLAKALRPFILRRTKQQVAKELPAKTEQTIYCEMDPSQRALYNELRDHYRQSLLGLIDKEGIRKSKIQILEALLRLRQAACHPGLIDKGKLNLSSAKLDALLPQIHEVHEEGHKTLIFSQFTSMLAIVRDRLDRDGYIYEYLDGKTRDRAARVERFQNDPDCKLFLISLKAGGLGLNLTAAEYVFLLDPWWNPAVEAQAIDRAHRIGQSRQVFAYRLIARDSVEEKVLELQSKKRDLADAIINADNSLIRNLGRDDLELLLS